MNLLLDRWKRLEDRFWAGPDYMRNGDERKIVHFATVASSYWILGMLRRKFTLPALLMMPVTAVILLYSLVIIDSRMLDLVYLLLAVILVAWLAGLGFRLRGSLCRSLPRRVRAGSGFRIRYELHNRRKVPAFDIVCDPFGWSPLLKCVSPARAPKAAPGETAVMTAEVRALRRGIVPLYRPIAESAYPLNLIKWSVRGSRGDRLIIYPDFAPLAELRLPRGAIRRSTGSITSTLPGESPDLLGSRDFRTGDAVRHIDWPGTARRGGLLAVKEFAREEFQEIAVIADICPAKCRSGSVSPELEAAMSLAAAAADKLLRQSSLIRLLAAGKQVVNLRKKGCREAFDELCDCLAGIRPELEFHGAELENLLEPELPHLEAALVLMLDNTSDRVEFTRRLASRGAALKVILLAEHPSCPEIPEHWGHILPEDVLNGKVTAL